MAHYMYEVLITKPGFNRARLAVEHTREEALETAVNYSLTPEGAEAIIEIVPPDGIPDDAGEKV